MVWRNLRREEHERKRGFRYDSSGRKIIPGGRIRKPPPQRFVAHLQPWNQASQSLPRASEPPRLRGCGETLIVTRPNKMNAECRRGLQVALKSFDTIDYGSYLHIDYSYARLYSTRLLVQFQIAQLRHRTIRLRYVCHADERKRVLEEELPDLPDDLHECEALLSKFKTEFSELMDIVRRDNAMMNEWKHRNRSGGAYQHQKERFEREVAEIIEERIRIGSYAARWGRGARRSSSGSSARYRFCNFIPVHGPCDCKGSSVFSGGPSRTATQATRPLSAREVSDAVRADNHASSSAQLRRDDSRSCDKFDWYKGPRPIHPEWYKYPPGICRSGDMSKPPTRFEVAEARDVIRIQEELEREEAGVKRRSTVTEKRAAERVAAEQRGDWETVARIDRRVEEIRAGKLRRRRAYLAHKSQAQQACKRLNQDPRSDDEI